MWLKLHVYQVGRIGPVMLVNAARVQEIRNSDNGLGSRLIFGMKADGSVDQASVSEGIDEIETMLGGHIRSREKDADARFAARYAGTIKAANTPVDPED
jgi:hypothetical protein